MTYRIGWLSPLTPTSGVGTFSNAVVQSFQKSFDGEAIDLTVFYIAHGKLYRNDHRSIQINTDGNFHDLLTLFDLLIYNIGNNREHHEAIFDLLRLHPGIIICHDYVYQHYLADRSLRSAKSFASFAALLLKYGDATAADYLQRSRITSRTGRIRYSPWDSEASVSQPMSESVLALGSALIVHSAFAQRHAERRFKGPILKLGMPHDQKPLRDMTDLDNWERAIATKPFFNLLSFGHIQPTKCIDRVLCAIAASPILRKRLRYTVAGFVADYAYFDRLKAAVASLSLQAIVSFELDVSEGRLDELMQQADVFSNLRRPNTEGSSVSLIEQLDTGKPVVVLDSGCYAEIPSDAAVKLPPDVAIGDIVTALETLVGRPETMPAIGRGGRAYARTWTCASYADHVMQFVSKHRALFARRAKSMAIWSRPSEQRMVVDEWTQDLAKARLSLIYLDRGILAIDPAIVLGKTTDQLCEYTAHVIMGIFGNARLERALSRFFVRLGKLASYWACVRLALIVEAVFGDDQGARERLLNLKPCYDPEFWSVIEAFPSYQYLATATLVLMRRLPDPEELSAIGLDDQDGFPKRLRMLALLRGSTRTRNSGLEQLERWLNEACSPTLERDFPTIDNDLECDVGSRRFRETVELSGFYCMEADHAWTRAHQGFLGIRLSGLRTRVEVLVRHIDATPERPCAITVSCGNDVGMIDVDDTMPRWIGVTLSGPDTKASRVDWIRFSTDVACVPPSSSDTRVLGVCFLKLRVKNIEEAKVQDADASRPLLVHDDGPRFAHLDPSGSPRFGRRQTVRLEQ